MKATEFHDRFIISAYLLLLVVIAGAAIYVWQHHQVSNLDNKVAHLQSQLSAKQKVSTLDSGVDGLPATTYIPASSKTFTISQLQINISVPSYLDLTYNYRSDKSGNQYADLSSSSLGQLAGSCIANSTADNAKGTALGTIERGNGTGQNSANKLVLVQNQSYYLAYIAPQSSCLSGSASPTAIAVLTGQTDELKNSLINIQSN